MFKPSTYPAVHLRNIFEDSDKRTSSKLDRYDPRLPRIASSLSILSGGRTQTDYLKIDFILILLMTHKLCI